MLANLRNFVVHQWYFTVFENTKQKKNKYVSDNGNVCFDKVIQLFSISYCEQNLSGLPNWFNPTHVRTRPVSNCDARRDGKMEMSLSAGDNFTMSPVAARTLTSSSIMDSDTPRSGGVRRLLGLRLTRQQSATACVINSRYTATLSVSQSVRRWLNALSSWHRRHEQTHRTTRLTCRHTAE